VSGTKIGAKKTAAKNLAKDPNFYRTIGSKGGKHTGDKGFALNNDRAIAAGAKGGSKSRRGYKLIKETMFSFHYIQTSTGKIVKFKKI